MFLRSNLAEFGTDGAGAPHATQFWLAEEGAEDRPAGRLEAIRAGAGSVGPVPWWPGEPEAEVAGRLRNRPEAAGAAAGGAVPSACEAELVGAEPSGPGKPEAGAGAIRGVLGITEAGFALLQVPDPAAWPALRPLLSRPLAGLSGETSQVRRALADLPPTAPPWLDADETLYALDLAALRVPDGPGALRPLGRGDAETAARWRAAYNVETLGMPAEEAHATAPADVGRFAASGRYRLLVTEEGPVAMTGLNAALPDIVQVGGVFTPPERRGRGHARRAVALHLAEMRDAGVRRAMLFTGSPAAARAYEAVGFEPVGRFSIVLFGDG